MSLCPRHERDLAAWSDFGPHNPCTRYGLTGRQVAEQVALIREMCREGRGCNHKEESK